MERRELLKMIAVLTGGAVIGGEVFLSGCKSNTTATNVFEPFPWPKIPQGTASLTVEQIALLNEIGETIIPTTDSPGAKAAKVGEFMNILVADCYNEKQQAAFKAGIGAIQDACKKQTGKGFMECDVKQRHNFLVVLEKEAKAFNQKIDDDEKPKREALKKGNETKKWSEQVEFVGEPKHYYTMMKQLTLMGYFTSKEGATQALRSNPVPGKFDGAFPYKKGDKAWA